MATTPNYSWPTPDNTDLVRDGAEAIRDLGNAIDTTVDGIDKATTKGDLLVYDGTNYMRVGVGTDTHVLTADNVETAGLKWAAAPTGGLAVIATGTFSSGSQFDITSIPGTYEYLYLVVTGLQSSGNNSVLLQVNADGGSNYSRNGGSSDSSALNNNSSTTSVGTICIQSSSNTNTGFVAHFYNYTGGRSLIETYGFNGSNNFFRFNFSSYINGAITQINIVNAGGTFAAGSYTLYGGA